MVLSVAAEVFQGAKARLGVAGILQVRVTVQGVQRRYQALHGFLQLHAKGRGLLRNHRAVPFRNQRRASRPQGSGGALAACVLAPRPTIRNRPPAAS